METKSENVLWGSYSSWEGPFFPGTVGFSPWRPNATHAEELISVLTATEGGRFDAVNMYDVCIVSVGLIQYCEGGQYSTSRLLGAIADSGSKCLIDSGFADLLAELGYVFTSKVRGKWRFYKNSPTGLDEVDTQAEQRALFLGCDGKKGSWGAKDSPTRAYAKRWAATLANVLTSPAAMAVQTELIGSSLREFMMPYAKTVFPNPSKSSFPWNGVAYAAYLSFAGNNPKWASEQLHRYLSENPLPPCAEGGLMWNQDATVEMIAMLTFGPNVSIYPGRYDKIRPVLERIYSVDLPDFSAALPKDVAPLMRSTEEVQAMLLDLGYEMGHGGPNHDGVDGKWGPKSKAALMDFQRRSDLVQTGYPDTRTIKVLLGMKK